MAKVKKASESLTIMTNIVLPNETNSLRNLFGGELLAKMDRCASISAARHCERRVVTASVNHVSFNHPIPEGVLWFWNLKFQEHSPLQWKFM